MNEWGIMGKYIMLMALDDSHRVLPHIITVDVFITIEQPKLIRNIRV